MTQKLEAIASTLKNAGFPTAIEHNRIKVAFKNRVCGTNEVTIVLADAIESGLVRIDRHCLDVMVEVL